MDNEILTPSIPQVPQQPVASFLPGPAVILKQAWSLYKQRFGTFLGITVIPMLVMTAFGLLSAAGGFLAVTKPGLGSFGLLLVLGVVLFIVALVIFPWGLLALLFAVKDSTENIGVGTAFRRAWGKIRSYYWITILMTLILVGGLMLLIVPGIVFMIWFGFAMFVLVDEGLKGMDALLKSREYVRGQWWGIFGRLLVMWLLAIVVAMIQAIILKTVSSEATKQLVQFLVSLFLTPFIISYTYILYQNLKTLKGGTVRVEAGSQKTIFILIGILGLAAPIILTFLLASSESSFFGLS